MTSSSTIAAGACQSAGIGPTHIDAVVGITKAYATRVGGGPFPTEIEGELGQRLRDAGGEYGATTGRPRRCGWLDLPALRMGVRLSGMQSLALTKLDVLAGFPEVSVCVAYDLDGKELDEPPTEPDDLARAKPIYAKMAGWGCRRRRGRTSTRFRRWPGCRSVWCRSARIARRRSDLPTRSPSNPRGCDTILFAKPGWDLGVTRT